MSGPWSSRGGIVQPEIGHASYRHAVLLVSSEAPSVGMFLQDYPHEQSEAISRSHLVVLARVRVYRLPRRSGPVIPRHPSGGVDRASVNHAQKFVAYRVKLFVA